MARSAPLSREKKKKRQQQQQHMQLLRLCPPHPFTKKKMIGVPNPIQNLCVSCRVVSCRQKE